MTLLMFTGFEGYNSPADQRDAGDGIAYLESASEIVYTTGRNGGNALKCVGTVWSRVTGINFPPITNDKIAIVGFAFRINAFGDGVNLCYFGNTSDIDAVEMIITESSILCRAVAFSTKASVYFTPNLNQWYYVEAKVKLHSSSGYACIKINEQQILEYSGSLTWSGTTVNRLELGCLRYSNSYIDDVYVADNQGSDVNDFLGDIRVDSIRPNGAGNYAQLTPSAGNNYECVDESELNESDYVEGATDGLKDSYSYGSVPTDLDDTAIIALQIKNNSKRTATADTRKITPFIRTGSTDYSQTDQSLSDDFAMVDGDMIYNDPSDSNPWTQVKINACEFGMEVGT